MLEIKKSLCEAKNADRIKVTNDKIVIKLGCNLNKAEIKKMGIEINLSNGKTGLSLS